LIHQEFINKNNRNPLKNKKCPGIRILFTLALLTVLPGRKSECITPIIADLFATIRFLVVKPPLKGGLTGLPFRWRILACWVI